MIFYLRSDSSTQPNIPSTTKQTTDGVTMGSYDGPKDISLANGSSFIQATFSGFVDTFETFASAGFIYPVGLQGNQTIGGSATLDIFASFTNEIPPPVTESSTLKAALFVWRSPNVFQLGATASNVLTNTLTNYNFSFGSFSFAAQRCDRIYLEIWAQSSSGGFPGNITTNAAYNSAARPGIITTSQTWMFETYRTGTPSRVSTPTRLATPTKISSPGKVKC